MIKTLNIGVRYKKWREEVHSYAFDLLQISFYLQLFESAKDTYTLNCQILQKANNKWATKLTP